MAGALLGLYDVGLFHNIDPQAAELWQMMASAPLIGSLPFNDPSMSSYFDEWDESDTLMVSTTLGAAISTTTATSITVSAATYIKYYDVLLIETELVRVTAISGTTLTVSRGFAGSTAATHASGVAVYIKSGAWVDGVDTPAAVMAAFTRNTNYMQEIQVPITISDRVLRSATTAGDAQAIAYNNALLELWVRAENAILFNVSTGAGSSSTPATVKGIPGFVTTSVYDCNSATIGGDGSTHSITFDKINAMGAILNGRGAGNIFNCHCGTNAFRYTNDALRNASIPPQAGVNRRFGFVWREVETEFGLFRFILNKNMVTGTMHIMDVSRPPEQAGFSITESNAWGLGVMSDPHEKELGATGTTTKKTLVGSFTLRGKLADYVNGTVYGITSAA